MELMTKGPSSRTEDPPVGMDYLAVIVLMMMAVSASLARAVTGGRLLRLVAMLGPGPCTRATPLSTATLTIKAAGFLSAVSGTKIMASTMDDTQQIS